MHVKWTVNVIYLYLTVPENAVESITSTGGVQLQHTTLHMVTGINKFVTTLSTVITTKNGTTILYQQMDGLLQLLFSGGLWSFAAVVA